MKLLLYLLMLTSCRLATGQTVDQIENRRLEALQNADYEFVEHLLAPQFVMTRPDGTVLERNRTMIEVVHRLPFQNETQLSASKA